MKSYIENNLRSPYTSLCLAREPLEGGVVSHRYAYTPLPIFVMVH
jgi:hypothetical protein